MDGQKFKAGMYLLETLTSGMYNEPMSIYREYVQNSVDAIDQSGLFPNDSKITIDLDPLNRSVTIRDNGPGIAADLAEQTLSSIGSSGKKGSELRGFRGIGRLGGIAFSRRVVFKTAAKGENVVSKQEWDCDGLRFYLNSPEHSSLTIEDLFKKISTFSQTERKSENRSSYFEVQLLDVNSFRNYIFDLQKVKKYLVEVSPLPFAKNLFSHYDEVTYYLEGKVPHYGEYKIFVNGEQLFKPYKDEFVITSKKGNDALQCIELFPLISESKPLAFGWYGVRNGLLGAISKGEGISGIRVKVGNIQIGDNHILDRCFREGRFNSYFIGEVHVVDQSLIPNSRRDDFVDNDSKAKFYNAIEKQIGLPLSKEVRQRSKLNVKEQQNKQVREHSILSNGIKSEKDTIESTENNFPKGIRDQKEINKAFEACGNCEKLKAILRIYKN